MDEAKTKSNDEIYDQWVEYMKKRKEMKQQ